jgi:hypothetical protein
MNGRIGDGKWRNVL